MKGVVAVLVLVSIFIYSAMDLITVRYQQRLLYNDLVRAQNVEQKLNQVWSYLQLERANLTSTAYINTVMAQKLSLKPADIGQIIYIKDSELHKHNSVIGKE
ncbi:cell division protein FtsL [Pelistega indica]|uniref:Cell division protein FtsL n=1 Tax=Pelistega indica TaxID=1414851 RepID=V8G720_9BURK|nr:cell division protein FtsL [Pelistega indica]ETD72339.1 cell division protein FtsL [Pelistega indica]